MKMLPKKERLVDVLSKKEEMPLKIPLEEKRLVNLILKKEELPV